MANYAWAESLVANTTIIKASHFTELHANTNTEVVARGGGAATWTYTPTQYVTPATRLDAAEIRAYLDYAHTWNYCTSVCAINYDHCASNYSYYSSYNSYLNCPSHYAAYRTTYCSAYAGGAYGSHYASYCITNYTSN